MNKPVALWSLALISVPFLLVFVYFADPDFNGAAQLALITGLIVLSAVLFSLFLKSASAFKRRSEQAIRIKQITIPTYRPPADLRFYELGYMVDGEFDDVDVLATALYYILHTGEVSAADELEQKIIRTYVDNPSNLHSLIYNVDYKALFSHDSAYLSTAVYGDLQRKGYISYNPGFVQFIAANVGTLMLGYIWLGWLLVYYILDQTAGGGVQMFWIAAGTAVVALYILFMCAIAASFAHSFHEISDKTVPLRTKVLGYRMFLKTADYFRVEKDREAFVTLAPYFIALRVQRKHWKQLFEHVLEHHVPGGTSAYYEYARERYRREHK
ncbi:MAG: hypothetical protein TR69_WS6001000783 [candidate division WS6 bacterium OLB20]|uniref:DUF2207 domain-containing protein n=1 Tax=candidate division WS6 bacterium OLB20 TaxID=1617426 RepID=A0A136LYL6_9BACT|nr:MAG: hypothetical protein TR69_WS6001000783 [candidate division WS6 bacterium OLB20]